MQLNFLEAIGALTLIGGALYFWLNSTDQKDKDIEFFRWILKNDSIAREEFTSRYREWEIGTSDYKYNKALREFFTEEKLAEVNARMEEKEGTSK